MARKRMKDRSDFSILVKFPEEMKSAAMLVVTFAKKTFPAIRITEQSPEENQRYFYILLEIAKCKK